MLLSLYLIENTIQIMVRSSFAVGRIIIRPFYEFTNTLLTFPLLMKQALTEMNDRRSGLERRNLSSLNFRSLIHGGNRMHLRRKEDRERIYFVDQYSPKLFIAIVAILFMCVIDALLTLFLIGHGAYQVNPIFAYLLDVDLYTFFIAKYSATIIVTLGLFLLKGIVIQKLNVDAQSFLNFAAGLYTIVVGWELYLVSAVVI